MYNREEPTIHVMKTELLEKLTENRDKHEKVFTADMKIWKKKCRKALKKAYRKAEDEDWIDLNPLGDLPKPKSYLDSYESAILRISFEVRDTIEITQEQFAAWVEDNWVWRGQFVANSYSTSLA